MTASQTDKTEDGLLLPGLDGANPLGFLASLGVLRAVGNNNSSTSAQMQWEQSGATWVPRVFGGFRDVDGLLKSVGVILSGLDFSSWEIDKKLPFEATRLRNEALDAITSSGLKSRDYLDTLAAFGVECFEDSKGNFKDTSLRMVRAGDSAGNGLLAYGRRIITETTESDIRMTLTEPWKLEDEGCALRWDPEEYHGYAMQWSDPSAEKTVSVRGGNRLALDAMPFLPTVPKKGGVQTVGFGSPKFSLESFTWPLWNVPASLDIVKSLLTIGLLQDKVPDPMKMRARGIGAVYRCDRIMTSTYYRNFTPAQRIA